MTTHTASLCAALVVCVAAATLAQQPRDVQRGGVPTGGAAITGVVLSDDAYPKPLRRVRVTLNTTGRTFGHTAITNDKGEFSFTQLPAGRYLVSGVKDGYVTMHHGARRPNRPGVSIALAANETRSITLRLPVGGVITGTVLDANGLPAPAVNVQAMAYRVASGAARRLMPIDGSGWVTDDRGEYRIFGLPPGDYIVSARPPGPANSELEVLSQSEIRRALAELRDTRQQTRPGPPATPRRAPLVEEPRRTVSLAPVMYPGTTSIANAATVTLGLGELRTGIDIQLQHVAIARVRGTVYSQSRSPGRVMVSLLLPGAQLGSSQPLEHFRTTSANALGVFSFVGVPPGHYTILARTTPRPSHLDQWASTEIVLAGDDVTNVVLSLRDGLTISGRIAFESEHPPDLDLAGLELDLPMQMAGAMPRPAPRAALRLEAGRRFVLGDIVPGAYALSDTRGVRSAIGPWWLKSITIDGRDLLDAPLHLKQSADGAVVTFTDRTTEVSGTVKDAEGQPSPDGFVVVFSADRASWFPGSRRVAGDRPSSEGRYRFRNLPPGDYFIIAHDDVEDGEWADPTLLARLAPQAVRITVAEFEQKMLDLRLPARE